MVIFLIDKGDELERRLVTASKTDNQDTPQLNSFQKGRISMSISARGSST